MPCLDGINVRILRLHYGREEGELERSLPTLCCSASCPLLDWERTKAQLGTSDAEEILGYAGVLFSVESKKR